ncbi:MAG: DNA mismatch repair protein MutS [Planctomycetes bacterium]|nr:DNA mismatch repair protein MutS [Planctomycetota bacterium]
MTRADENNAKQDTPAMRQHRRFKQEHPDCVLFFRMGDFYELFYDDALLAHKVLGVTLTQRTEGVPMAGVPYHAVEGYLRRMIAAGYRVAICEQMEDPKEAKGVVKREVTRLVTPGTLTDDAMLEEGEPCVLAAVQFVNDDTVALAFAELSTGALSVAQFASDTVADELARIGPRELLYVETANGQPPERISGLAGPIGCALTRRPAWQFRMAEATETLMKQFNVTTLAGFGLEADDIVIGPAGAVVSYLLETQQSRDGRLAHLSPPRRFERHAHLVIDQTSLRSLEIERTLRTGETKGSLLGALQDCRTAMGKRALRQWLCYPLADKAKIIDRQDAVAAIVDDATFRADLTKRLDAVQDVERISGRVAIGRPSPRDLVGLGNSLTDVNKLIDLLDARPTLAAYHHRLTAIAPSLNKLGDCIRAACVDDPPAHMRDGGLIRDSYDKTLDEYRTLQRDSNTYLADYQKRLADETGIGSLKIGYNKVFGYYIEVTHVHATKIPAVFTRKQTLKNAERYITPQLKEYEDKVLGASSKAIARELDLFNDLCKATSDDLTALHEFSHVVAELDVLACFARRAVKYQYTRPNIVDEPTLIITDGRHPVLDEILADRFVPNDTELDKKATLALITGPNMAGKSTYIRQNALLTLLAHTGAFIPAASATIGLTDRIFTRIGASDEIHLGQSTFMVEMTETANICHHASPRSLVILDEIGRGTSTLDGLALAWAIAEHLAARRCRCLFATHYHELTELPERFDNVVNLNVTVREWNNEIAFLHRIAPGAANKSYGIHVAKIAGLPDGVLTRANELMAQLQVHTESHVGKSPKPQSQEQWGLFTQYVEHPALTQLRESDLNALSPLGAFDLLRKLRAELDK